MIMPTSRDFAETRECLKLYKHSRTEVMDEFLKYHERRLLKSIHFKLKPIHFKSISPSRLIVHVDGDEVQEYTFDSDSWLSRAFTVAWLVFENGSFDLRDIAMPDDKNTEDQLRRALRVDLVKWAERVGLVQLTPLFLSIKVTKNRAVYEHNELHPKIITGII
jgi:hypothetical protein